MTKEDKVNPWVSYVVIILVIGAIIGIYFFLEQQQKNVPTVNLADTQAETVKSPEHAKEIAGNVSRTVEDIAASMEGIGSAFG